jgi:hypothetical protein
MSQIVFDEMFAQGSQPRPHYRLFYEWLQKQNDAIMNLKRAEAD